MSFSKPNLCDFINAFKKALLEAGIVISKPPIADGKTRYLHIDGHKPGTEKLMYCLHYDDNPGGYFTNLKTGAYTTWNYFRDYASKNREKEKGSTYVNINKNKDSEILTKNSSFEENSKKERESKENNILKYLKIYNSIKKVTSDFKYLKNKGIDINSVKFPISKRFPNCEVNHYEPRFDPVSNLMIVPLFQYKADSFSYILTGFETITEDGSKKSIYGSIKSESASFIGLPFSGDTPFLICEGYSTGLAISISTGKPVVCVLGASNLKKYSHGWTFGEIKYPAIICSDDDKYQNSIGEVDNAGQKCAIELALTSNALSVAKPEFKPEDENGRKLTDFCDVFKLYGAEEVKRQINNSKKYFKENKLTMSKNNENVQKEPSEKVQELTTGKEDTKFTLESLISMMRAKKFKFFTNTIGFNFIEVYDLDGLYKIVSVDNKGSSHCFKELVQHFCYTIYGQIPSDTLLNQAARWACVECKKHKIETYKRIAKVGDDYIVDFGYQFRKRAFKINSNSIEVVDNFPAVFIKNSIVKPFLEPDLSSPIDDIFCLNVFLNVSETEFLFIVAFMLDCWRVNTPYQMLAIIGEEGTAKSTMQKRIIEIVDPSHAPLIEIDQKDLNNSYLDADSRHVLSFENESHLTLETQDFLCKVTTGSGKTKRELYTDGNVKLMKAFSPVIINGISDFVTRPDLRSRTVHVNALEFGQNGQKRISEIELDAQWNMVKPCIFGAFVNLFSKTLAQIELIKDSVSYDERQNDFLVLLEAVGRVLNIGYSLADNFLIRSQDSKLDALLDNPISATIIDLWHAREKRGEFVIDNEELFAIVKERYKDYPEIKNMSHYKMRSELKRIESLIKSQGYVITNLPVKRVGNNTRRSKLIKKIIVQDQKNTIGNVIKINSKQSDSDKNIDLENLCDQFLDGSDEVVS